MKHTLVALLTCCILIVTCSFAEECQISSEATTLIDNYLKAVYEEDLNSFQKTYHPNAEINLKKTEERWKRWHLRPKLIKLKCLFNETDLLILRAEIITTYNVKSSKTTKGDFLFVLKKFNDEWKIYVVSLLESNFIG